MVKIDTVADVIGLWPSAEAFGDDLGLKWRSYGRVMRLRGRIPRDHWPKVVESALRRGYPVTEQTLERVHQPQPAACA